MTEESRYAESVASDVRRGVIGLARRLRMERDGAGLTALELSLLGHLRRRGPQTPGALATAERIQPQSLTRALAGLEDAGLLTRQADPADGRRSVLAFTPSGEAALRSEMVKRDRWLAELMAERLTHTEIGLLHLASALLDDLADP